jgi:hypothetical protein
MGFEPTIVSLQDAKRTGLDDCFITCDDLIGVTGLSVVLARLDASGELKRVLVDKKGQATPWAPQEAGSSIHPTNTTLKSKWVCGQAVQLGKSKLGKPKRWYLQLTTRWICDTVETALTSEAAIALSRSTWS